MEKLVTANRKKFPTLSVFHLGNKVYFYRLLLLVNLRLIDGQELEELTKDSPFDTQLLIF
ncbi:MAG: hypothetical protein ACUVWV_06445 [Thermodesulfobacteriota bacterium]